MNRPATIPNPKVETPEYAQALKLYQSQINKIDVWYDKVIQKHQLAYEVAAKQLEVEHLTKVKPFMDKRRELIMKANDRFIKSTTGALATTQGTEG